MLLDNETSSQELVRMVTDSSCGLLFIILFVLIREGLGQAGQINSVWHTRYSVRIALRNKTLPAPPTHVDYSMQGLGGAGGDITVIT